MHTVAMGGSCLTPPPPWPTFSILPLNLIPRDARGIALHTVAWEQSGNPDGIPVVVIHGGPGVEANLPTGNTSTPRPSTSCNLTNGCGKSTPYAELEDNNTHASVGDIEASANASWN